MAAISVYIAAIVLFLTALASLPVAPNMVTWTLIGAGWIVLAVGYATAILTILNKGRC